MRVSEMIAKAGCEYMLFGDGEVDVEYLSLSSLDIKKNTLFFAIIGDKFNGENFISDAVSKGAVVVVAQNKIKVSKRVKCLIVVPDVRIAMSLIACSFYDFPSNKLQMVGVTGTNGKTTTSHILFQILNRANISCALIGTNGIFIGKDCFKTILTTPDPIELQCYLALFVERNIKVCVMEVSAHSLALGKLMGIRFCVSAFTNLTQDHFDFFYNYENYFNTKLKLFDSKVSNYGVFNYDDNYAFRASSLSNLPFSSFGSKNSDYIILDRTVKKLKQSFKIYAFGQYYKCKVNFLGEYNIYNSVCAIVCAEKLGVNIDKSVKLLRCINLPSGRGNVIDVGKNGTAILDFAHTPDGLEKILISARENFDKGKIICLFACGGDRDRTKRPIMGQIAGRLADVVIVSSDNPANENPLDIINDVCVGLTKIKTDNIYKIVDRKEAVNLALSLGTKNDCVLILGKGTEDYMITKNGKEYYSDYDEIINFVKKLT